MVRITVRDPHVRLLLMITVGIFVLMSAIRPEVFLSWNNLRSISFQFPEFALLAMAISVTMLTGGIDLSVVSTALLAACLGGILQLGFSDQTPGLLGSGMVVIVIVLSGLICGLINGLLVTRVKISPILATLGTMQVYSGLTVVLTGGTALYGFPESFLYFGNGSFYGIPMPLVIFAFAVAVCSFLLNRTAFGFRLYLIGENPRAARFAGMKNSRILAQTYILSGVLASVAGLIMASRVNSINADYGSSYLLLSILVAVLGGVNPDGGFGRISGLVLAVLSLQFLASGLNMLRFSSFAKDLVWGALLLVVMVEYQTMKKRRCLERTALPSEDRT